ncbi:hypothetical protein E2C01_025993 [Portunus trituberculatus]|uniref:Uncharacterized protein n=1 Tax=Portunus trituberculatus TaxID=210409 RepID=A0A5B7EGY0_PORTR|nr:hypothetical protein [Portunus trituberculatus]
MVYPARYRRVRIMASANTSVSTDATNGATVQILLTNEDSDSGSLLPDTGTLGPGSGTTNVPHHRDL